MEYVTTKPIFTKGKIAHFNIADMHLFHTLANRVDFLGEGLAIIDYIGSLVDRYKRQGYTCVSLLNGDVAHKGSATDSKNDPVAQAIKLLLSFFDENYLNIGNHEITYHKNNPIYKFIDSIEDERVIRRHPQIRTSSLLRDLRVVPILEYNDFEIVFTPYGEYPERGTREKSILVMHDDLLSAHARNKLASEMPMYKIKPYGIPDETFDYVFCGHNHMVLEKWESGSTQIYNLASLGRSNVKEVDDSFRQRIIPIILSEDGNFSKIAEESITLHPRCDIVSEQEVEESKSKYEVQKDRAEVRKQLAISSTTNPLEALEIDIEASGNNELSIMFGILKSGRVVSYKEVKEELRNRKGEMEHVTS